MFSKVELVVIARCLKAGNQLEKKSQAELKNLIKTKIGTLLEEAEHVGDIIDWLEETYPEKFEDMNPEDIDLVVEVVKGYIYDNYPRFDKHTMAELLVMFEDELKEEISELV